MMSWSEEDLLSRGGQEGCVWHRRDYHIVFAFTDLNNTVVGDHPTSNTAMSITCSNWVRSTSESLMPRQGAWAGT